MRVLALIASLCFSSTAVNAARARARSQEFLSQGSALAESAGAEVNAQSQQGVEAAVQAAASGLQEVVDLLRSMLTAFDEQMVEDKKLWEEYSSWSDGSEQEKRDFIQEQKALVMSTTAKKQANMQMVATLTEELATLASEIAQTEAGIAELIQMRKEEHEQFQAAQADLTKTIRAVVKATEILEGHYAAADATALAEIRKRVEIALTMYGPSTLRSATPSNMKALESFLQMGRAPDFLNTDGSKYDNYEKQGGARGVIGMLTDLQSELESQLQTLIAREAEARRQYEQTKAAKEADLKNMKETQATKTQEKQTAEAIIEECITTIDQAEKDIADAEEFVRVLLQDREKFTKEFGVRTSTRTDEQAATQAALDALQQVSAGAKSTVGAALMQGGSGQNEMFLQTSSRTQRVINRLSSTGSSLGSVSLLQVASKLRNKDDYLSTQQQSFHDASGFDPVIKLLTDLITRLEEEQSAETSQHEWCETEKNAGVASKTERESNIADLKAKIEEATTQCATLKTEIEFMESEIARVQQENEDAKKLRKEQHDAFVKAKADHEEVIKAIQLALEALSGQYGFLQVSSKTTQTQSNQQAPGQAAVFSDYQSGEGGAGSAIEMLNDLESRYSTALQELITTEEEQQKAHDELIATNEQFIADTTNSKNAKLKERRAKLNHLGDAKTEMKTNLIELHEVSKYLMDLRPSCDDIRSTFEERKKRREAEISALKEALDVISDPSMMSASV